MWFQHKVISCCRFIILKVGESSCQVLKVRVQSSPACLVGYQPMQLTQLTYDGCRHHHFLTIWNISYSIHWVCCVHTEHGSIGTFSCNFSSWWWNCWLWSTDSPVPGNAPLKTHNETKPVCGVQYSVAAYALWNWPFSSGGQKWALTGVIHRNMHVIVLSCTRLQKNMYVSM